MFNAMLQFHFDEVESTQDEIRRNFQVFENCPDQIIMVSADRQTSGKGREGRVWISKGECVAMSFAFILKRNNWNPATLGAVLALSADSALTEILGESIDGIKWPNDLILKGRKIGGVLSEIVKSGDREIAVMGIGINLKIEINYLPERLIYPAGSIRDFFPNMNTTAQNVRDKIAERFNSNLHIWNSRGFAAFHGNLNCRICLLGEDIRIGDITGQVCGVNEEGMLLLRTNDGIQKIAAGEIIQ